MSREEALLASVEGKPLVSKLGVFARLSGPGWLQSAITLGGGSLGASLYLGVIGGYDMLWVQPMAMILGIILLATIGYVTLTTGKRPFGEIRDKVNPVLAWAWLIATILANCVWILPQFTLAVGSLTGNLFPEMNKVVATALLAAIAIGVIWFYDAGGKGIKFFENALKIVVGLIVLCFVLVVIKLAGSGALEWGRIFQGFVPNPSLLFSPSATFDAPLAALGDGESATYWREYITGQQRDQIFAGMAVAVGINMTFLLPYSMLARGWGKAHRGLSIFDLSTGLFIPFLVVISCIVIASAAEFNGKYDDAVVTDPTTSAAAYKLLTPRLDESIQTELDALAPEETPMAASDDEILRLQTLNADRATQRAAIFAAVPEADRQLAAMLVKRDVDTFGQSLSNIAGEATGKIIFGIGVVAIGLSTIIVLMLINGYAVCEALGVEPKGMPRRLGSLFPVLLGVLGPFYWKDAAAYLVIPTSVFGLMLIPVAAWTFFLLFNNRRVMGDEGPTGGKRALANGLILLSCSILTAASLYAVWLKSEWKGFAAIGVLLLLTVVVHFVFPRKTKA